MNWKKKLYNFIPDSYKLPKTQIFHNKRLSPLSWQNEKC